MSILAGLGLSALSTGLQAWYNSPKQQIKRLEKAGIHKNAFYSMGDTGNISSGFANNIGPVASSMAQQSQYRLAQESFDELKGINANPKPSLSGNVGIDVQRMSRYGALGGQLTDGLNPRQFKALAEGTQSFTGANKNTADAQYTAGVLTDKTAQDTDTGASQEALNWQKIQESIASADFTRVQTTHEAEKQALTVLKQATEKANAALSEEQRLDLQRKAEVYDAQITELFAKADNLDSLTDNQKETLKQLELKTDELQHLSKWFEDNAKAKRDILQSYVSITGSTEEEKAIETAIAEAINQIKDPDYKLVVQALYMIAKTIGGAGSIGGASIHFGN